MSLFRAVLGEAFEALPACVQRVHGAKAESRFAGRGVARGSRNPFIAWGRRLLGLPQPGRYRQLIVEVHPSAAGETWRRAFGPHRFASRLRLAGAGRFEESFGPLGFVFAAEPRPTGLTWRLVEWRLGRLAMPRAAAPRLRARIFEADGVYRFRAVAAHPWLGVLFAYAGRLS